MSELTPFDFHSHRVRVVTIDGEPWFVVNDVCAALGIDNPRDAIVRLRSVSVGQTDVQDSAGRMRRTNVVNESGLYRLILRSDKPEAEAFQDWVTDDVLPQIRRTGGYGQRSALSPAEFLLQQAQMLVDQERRTRELENRTRVIEAKQSAQDGAYDEFTALAYAKLNDLPTDRVSCQLHGQRATRLMRQRGSEPRKRQDATFGTVNVYPAAILDETANLTV